MLSNRRGGSPKLSDVPKKIEDLGAGISRIHWYHQIDLGGGFVTPGGVRCSRVLKRICLPVDLSGLEILDIGAWDGYYSFEAERRGARRVVALDRWSEEAGGSKEGFEFARKILKSRVESVTMDAMEISPETIGQFDIVLFLGVLYHMRHPLRGLEKIASVHTRSIDSRNTRGFVFDQQAGDGVLSRARTEQRPKYLVGPKSSSRRLNVEGCWFLKG